MWNLFLRVVRAGVVRFDFLSNFLKALSEATDTFAYAAHKFRYFLSAEEEKHHQGYYNDFGGSQASEKEQYYCGQSHKLRLSSGWKDLYNANVRKKL